MDEIAALSSWERDDLHRGIFSAMRNEPYDEFETKHWKWGWELYRDTRPGCREQEATCH